MAAIFEAETEFHAGETQMHKLLKVPMQDNPTSPYLTPYAASILQRSPLVALGIVDDQGRPWTAVWGGRAGFSRAVAQSIIVVNTTIDNSFDPVAETLFEGKLNGELIKVARNETGKMVSGLGIDLETRSRIKLYGRMIGGAFSSFPDGVGNAQVLLEIEQSLGNCPKYLNKKHITTHVPKPVLAASSFPIPKTATDLIAASDLFFISSSHRDADMDTNHRGGPPGFVRVLSNDETGLYSGNRLYQTLGNLLETPRAGLVFPDFDTGDVLYLTGKTEILTGKDASDLLAHTNIAVKITAEAFRFVKDGLNFRGQLGERSPYNPQVRYLSNEDKLTLSSPTTTQAKLISRDLLSPGIARFRFQLLEAPSSTWKPGQYVTLDFSEELDIGYSHMREDDPKSLNDDYVRTFTVSSRPGENKDFEITIRKEGPVTTHLFKHNMRIPLEIPVLGFGGEFHIQQAEGEKIIFLAGGVGITPFLVQAPDLDLKHLVLYWTVRAEDLGLVADTFDLIPGLAAATRLFVTKKSDQKKNKFWDAITKSGASPFSGRVSKDDLTTETVSKWYLCANTGLRKTILEWFPEKEVVYENFNY